MARKKNPDLQVVEPDADETPTANADAEETPAAPATPPPARITVLDQISRYAGMVRDIKTQTRLGEGTIVRLIELALNERFTLIQMGLANPANVPSIEESNDESSS